MPILQSRTKKTKCNRKSTEKRLKVKRFTVNDNVFKATINVMLNCSQEYHVKWIKNKHGIETENIPGSDGSFCSAETDGGTLYFVWLEAFGWKIKQQGVLNHELIHCAYTILTDRNILINDSTEEVLAYYHTWLKEEVYKKLV